MGSGSKALKTKVHQLNRAGIGGIPPATLSGIGMLSFSPIKIFAEVGRLTTIQM